MASHKKKATIESLIGDIGKLKSQHQSYIFKLNKRNEILEGQLKTQKEQTVEKQNTINIMQKDIDSLHLKIKQLEDELQQKSITETKNQCVEKTKQDFEVEEIIGDKVLKRTKHYLVQWKGYNKEHNSWEPKKNLNCPAILEKYEKCKAERKHKQ